MLCSVVQFGGAVRGVFILGVGALALFLAPRGARLPSNGRGAPVLWGGASFGAVSPVVPKRVKCRSLGEPVNVGVHPRQKFPRV